MGGGGSSAPEESRETRALTAQQAAMLSNVQGTVEQLDPYIFQALGFNYTPTGTATPATITEDRVFRTGVSKGADREVWNMGGDLGVADRGGPVYTIQKGGYQPGNVGFSLTPMTEEERYAALSGMDKNLHDLGMLQYQRLLDAYQGNLGISPELENQLAKQEQQIAASLSQKLGPNWMQSTPGIQAMGEFRKQAELLREEARRAQLAEGQGLLFNNLGYQQQTQQQKLSNMVNIPMARYSGSLDAGQGLLNSMVQRDQYKASYAMQNQKPSAAQAGLGGALAGAGVGASVGGVPGAVVGGVVGAIGGLLAR